MQITPWASLANTLRWLPVALRMVSKIPHRAGKPRVTQLFSVFIAPSPTRLANLSPYFMRPGLLLASCVRKTSSLRDLRPDIHKLWLTVHALPHPHPCPHPPAPPTFHLRYPLGPGEVLFPCWMLCSRALAHGAFPELWTSGQLHLDGGQRCSPARSRQRQVRRRLLLSTAGDK